MPDLQIRFGQLDPSAKADIAGIVANATKPWSVLDDLKYDNIDDPGKFATCEWNHTILDGTFEEFPDTPNDPPRTWGLWSDELSGSDGVFASPPALDIVFQEHHKSAGLTLYFYPHTEDWCSRARVTWYGSQDISDPVFTGEYSMKSTVGVISQSVADWRHIKIEFLETNIPYRYIKLFALDYGLIRRVTDGEINTARVIEEIDPTGESLSINTFDCNIRTRESMFSPITSPEFDDMMMKRQILTVVKDGVPFGTFFLEDWLDPHQSGIVFDISGGDAVSVMDMYEHRGGLYVDYPVSDLIAEIFNIVFPTQLIKYIIDPVFDNAAVTGWLPIGTCALALQHICFALDAVCDTARIGDVWIYKRETDPAFEVPLDRQYRKGLDKPTPYYSGVDVYSYSFTPTAEQDTAYSGQLPAGEHVIKFGAPLHSLTITGGAIVAAHVNYAVISVPSAGEVVLTGLKYADNARAHSVRSQYVVAGEIEAVKEYEGYTLVTPDIAPSLAQSRYDWLVDNRIQTETEAALDALEVGYVGTVKTRGRDVVGTVVSLDTNLRADKTLMTVVGNVVMD